MAKPENHLLRWKWLVKRREDAFCGWGRNVGKVNRRKRGDLLLRPSKFEGHCPMIRHGCRMALMVALNW
ncbi:MAG: hypothetical protein BECKG1743D_GA0114223_104211, partial [Candidatus Kentron sp. G]